MISLQTMPPDYVLCPTTDAACPRAATCLRALAWRALAAGAATSEWFYIRCLNPSYAANPPARCEHYRDSTPVHYARGMTRIFDDVPVRVEKTVRRRVMSCFSCRNYYFLSRKGERLIRPEEQEAIARVFRSCVPGLEPTYDGYVDDIYW